MKIYTRTGDKGMTSLLGGSRVSKNHVRIEAYGTVDELNSYVGLLRDLDTNKDRRVLYMHIQDRLFMMGASLAQESSKETKFKSDLSQKDIEELEQVMDTMTNDLPEMRNFILPGGHQLVSFAHIARCVCRRAERRVIELAESDIVEEDVIVYLNRLSDYFFVLARKLSAELGVEEIKWSPRD
jgi:cob(I)alamin adenosyltransferase